MITNESVFKATLVEIRINDDGELEEYILNHKVIVVIDGEYVFNMETNSEYKIYNPNETHKPNTKYIYSLEPIQNRTPDLYNKAMSALTKFRKRKYKKEKAKILEFRPKENRDK